MISIESLRGVQHARAGRIYLRMSDTSTLFILLRPVGSEYRRQGRRRKWRAGRSDSRSRYSKQLFSSVRRPGRSAMARPSSRHAALQQSHVQSGSCDGWAQAPRTARHAKSNSPILFARIPLTTGRYTREKTPGGRTAPHHATQAAQ